MNNPEQMFYVKLDQNGAVIGQLTQDGYNKLSDADKKNYQEVLVDQKHLAGWGRYWYTAFYKNGALQYNSAWPADQSQQINELTNELKDTNSVVDSIKKQLANASSDQDKINNIQAIVMSLQQMMAQANK